MSIDWWPALFTAAFVGIVVGSIIGADGWARRHDQRVKEARDLERVMHAVRRPEIEHVRVIGSFRPIIAQELRDALDACPVDPDGQHHVGCGCHFEDES